MAKYTVCVTDDRHKDYNIEREILAGVDAELKVFNCQTQADIIANCSQADGILLTLAPMGAEAVKGLEKCRIISRYGVGCDNVDVAACTAKGIQVAYVPDYCAEDVSDHAIALMLACLRQVCFRDKAVRAGGWNLQGSGFRLQGKTLGILGFGRIARTLARKVSGFGFERVLVYDPYVSEEACREAGVLKADFDTVLKLSDFISLHMPATEETVGMINAETLALMKPTAIFVNTARGRLVNDEALIDALKNRRIMAAGLDTFNCEPVQESSGYIALDNVVLTDHTAYSTVESLVELKTKAAQNIADFFSGKLPAYPVNKI